MVSFRSTLLLVAASYLSLHASAHLDARAGSATPLWLTLPPTPNLPGKPVGQKTKVNGVEIWHAQFGKKSSSELPVLMLHGAFGSSNYWGNVVEILMKNHYVIVMDTRGQGRSTMDKTPFSYDLFAKDAAAILKSLGISKAAWVGWSDGADTALAGLLNKDIAPMISRAFTTGANHNVEAGNATFTNSPTYKEFVNRAQKEYQSFQPHGDLTALINALTVLGEHQPNWKESDLSKITLGSRLTLSWGEHEEAINLSEPKLMSSWIKGSKLVMMDGVSHFAPIQGPGQFAAAVETFLA